MRKLHWYNGDAHTACRPITAADTTGFRPALKVTEVNCKPCLKALGLSPIVFKAVAKHAICQIALPNGEKPDCLVEEFSFHIENNPTSSDKLIGRPEPVRLKIRLTDAGWDSLREAIVRKV